MRPKSSEKENRIIMTALDLFIKQGLDHTSTAQIAREAGIATGTLFTYFKTKEELIDAVYSYSLNSVIEATKDAVDINASSYDFIKKGSMSYILWALENKKEFYYIDLYNSSVYRKFDKIYSFFDKARFNEMFEKGKAEGVFKNIPVELAINFWTKANNGVATYAVESGLGADDVRLDQMVSLLMDGIISKE